MVVQLVAPHIFDLMNVNVCYVCYTCYEFFSPLSISGAIQYGFPTTV